MKKLFLLPVFALIAVMAVSSVSASGCCDCTAHGYMAPYTCSNGIANSAACNTLCGNDIGHYGEGQSCAGNYCVPEFTTIGAGIALAGAGLGFALIRKKRK